MDWDAALRALVELDFGYFIRLAAEIPVAVLTGVVVFILLISWLLGSSRRKAQEGMDPNDARETVLRDLQTLQTGDPPRSVDEPEPPVELTELVEPDPHPVDPPALRAGPAPDFGAAPAPPPDLDKEVTRLRAAQEEMKRELTVLRTELEALKKAATPRRMVPPAPTAFSDPAQSPRPADTPPRPAVPPATAGEDPSVTRARQAIEALEREERENG